MAMQVCELLPGTLMPRATRLGKLDYAATSNHAGLTLAADNLNIVLPKSLRACCLDPRTWHNAVFTHWPHFASNHSVFTWQLACSWDSAVLHVAGAAATMAISANSV